ncbi:aminoglycoside phosphotransferase family protein, partial [Streptomyces sp. SID625]|nr:aminoglycoside phosphotransferase family protein [Streptomyces sp. SID625]
MAAQVVRAARPGALGCDRPTTVLADRPDTTVVRYCGTVAKAHAPGADPAALVHRLAPAARLPDILLPPLDPAPVASDDRLVTFWPHGTP